MNHSSFLNSLKLVAPLAAALTAAGGCVDKDEDGLGEFVVINSTPAPQTTNVSTNNPLVLRFSQAVDPSSYSGTNQIILVDQANSPVPVTITPASGATPSEFVTITPAVPLATGTTYGVAVRELTRSVAGEVITAPWSAEFSTGPFVASIPGFPPFAPPNPGPVSAGAPGVFTLSGQMTTARSRQQAVRLPSGEVAVFGGVAGSPGGNVLASTEIYRPTTGTWTVSTGNLGRGMIYSRYGHTATVLSNGKVLITGGTDNSAIWDTAEIYDPLTDSFSPTPTAMTLPRAHHTATRIGNGNVVIAGGFAYNVAGNNTGGSSAFAVITDTIEVYDVPSGTFLNSSQKMTREKMYHTATALPDGDIVFAGGYILPFNAAFWCPTTGLADRYAPNLQQGVGEVASLLPIGNMKTPRMNHTATLYTSGNAQGLAIYIAGYETSPFNALLASAEVLDPSLSNPNGSAGQFALVAANLGEGRRAHTSNILGNGKDSGRILVVGGTTNAPPLQTPVSSAPPHLWTSADGSFCGACSARNTGELFDPFGYGQSLSLPFKGVDLTARFTFTQDGTGAQTQMVGTSASGVPGAGRFFHTATTLATGHVLFTGGWDCPLCTPTARGGDTALATSELYNP